MNKDSDQLVNPLWSLLAAVGGVKSETERARLITTSLPTLVPCDVSGLILFNNRTEICHAYLQIEGDQCPVNLTEQILSELSPLFQKVFVNVIFNLNSDENQGVDFQIPHSLKETGITQLAMIPLMTLGRRLGLMLIGKKLNNKFNQKEQSVLLTLAQQTAMGVDNLRLNETLKQYSQDLQRKNELVLKAAGEGIYGLDSEGKTTFVNPAAAEMLGWAIEELIGKSMHDLHHHSYPDGSDYPREECPIYAAFKDGKVHHVDDEIFWRKDGSSFPVEYTSTPIFENNNLTGAVVVFWNITERKLAEEALQSALSEVQILKDRLEAENIYLQEEIKLDHSFDEIIGRSTALKEELKKVKQVATTHATVLILGETGTGKELIARAIHNMSDRKDRPLVKINCAALPSDLIESELFGHEKGSFTGALTSKMGRFKLADGGTIFLDEIGDLPINLQAKLLRVLQEGEFEPVGNPNTINVDVRIIAATNRDLKKEVNNGQFREDLYYRLNVFPLVVPPLRERKSDIMLLVNFFANKYAKQCGKQIDKIPQSVKKSLEAYSWPGNIRELENLIERAVILSPGTTLSVDPPLLGIKHSAEDNESISMTLEEIERNHIIRVLEETNWVISGDHGAARILNIKPTTLRSRIKKLGIIRSTAPS